MIASLTWKIRRGQQWLTATCELPPENGARVVCDILREFAGKRFTPSEVDVTGEVHRFHYRTDGMTLQFRLLRRGKA